MRDYFWLMLERLVQGRTPASSSPPFDMNQAFRDAVAADPVRFTAAAPAAIEEARAAGYRAGLMTGHELTRARVVSLLRREGYVDMARRVDEIRIVWKS